ncbi:uncharacterized protein C12orf45 homolog isoform X1 [Rhinatrema bivittatum]|uniref:uncharacterized protein C12orf45 homolog isoform X1 n=1 Tax=Rhinatrema bivittatum TaxID=194408 RepID=UPI00112CC24C|nr:uncharacterized protein C12orf45 homolog isoform X1 [Rhinatrema bivittatum]
MTRDETGAVALYSHCVKMEGESGGPEVSRELLSVGCGTGLHEKLLINSKHVKRKATTLPIVKIPRSSVLDRVQQFLPQMARANEELTKEMATAPAGHFNIETIEDKLENIIEMNVAVVELSDSSTSSDEESSSEDSPQSDSDVSVTDEVTESSIRLPKQIGRKGTIEILNSKKD